MLVHSKVGLCCIMSAPEGSEESDTLQKGSNEMDVEEAGSSTAMDLSASNGSGSGDSSEEVEMTKEERAAERKREKERREFVKDLREKQNAAIAAETTVCILRRFKPSHCKQAAP